MSIFSILRGRENLPHVTPITKSRFGSQDMAAKQPARTSRTYRRSKPHIAADAHDKALQLVAAFGSPCSEAFDVARRVLNDVVAGGVRSDVTLAENLLVYLACALSAETLPGYATLDFGHLNEIDAVIRAIKQYSADSSHKRPLNFLMLASPGAGKSHFINCVAKKLGETIGAVTYNMVGLQHHEDLAPSLETVRNHKVEDKLPLLFLDEFDANSSNFALLLPLLWDGQLTLGRQDLKLGKIVIVLAGSDPRLPEAMERARSMRTGGVDFDIDRPKLIDLLSRINGVVLRIPELTRPRPVPERVADKVCIAVLLMRRRFGKQLERVPLALLRFIALAEFRYGVRSLAHLVDLIRYVPSAVDLSFNNLGLPLRTADDLRGSSLAYHVVHEDEAQGVVNVWNMASQSTAQVLIGHESVDYTLLLLRRERRLVSNVVLDRLINDFSSALSSAT